MSEGEFDAVAAAAELAEALGEDGEGAESAAAGEADYVASLEKELVELNALLERSQRAVADAEARADQAAEDVSAARQRLEREMAQKLEVRSRDLLAPFLEIVDDLERALASARENQNTTAVVDGVEMILKRMLATLGQRGVVRQNALGQSFDPAQHEAVTTQPVGDRESSGKVLTVVRTGYNIGDEVLRPAMVIVGRMEG